METNVIFIEKGDMIGVKIGERSFFVPSEPRSSSLAILFQHTYEQGGLAFAKELGENLDDRYK